MRAAWHRFMAPLTPGVRALLLVLTISYLVAVAGVFSHAYNLYAPLALSGPEFWKGKVWQIVTYSLLPAGLFDFLFNWIMVLFLGACLEKLWSRRQLWAYCLIPAIGAAVAKVLIEPSSPRLMVGT